MGLCGFWFGFVWQIMWVCVDFCLGLYGRSYGFVLIFVWLDFGLGFGMIFVWLDCWVVLS